MFSFFGVFFYQNISVQEMLTLPGFRAKDGKKKQSTQRILFCDNLRNLFPLIIREFVAEKINLFLHQRRFPPEFSLFSSRLAQRSFFSFSYYFKASIALAK